MKSFGPFREHLSHSFDKRHYAFQTIQEKAQSIRLFHNRRTHEDKILGLSLIAPLVIVNPSAGRAASDEEIETPPPAAPNLQAKFLPYCHHLHLSWPASKPGRIVVDTFWKTPYALAGVDTNALWSVQSTIDGQRIPAYFNCGFLAYRPALGLFHAWREGFAKLLNNPKLRAKVAFDDFHSGYMHQALLSAVPLARLRQDQIQILSPRYGPLHGVLPKCPNAKDRNPGQPESGYIPEGWERLAGD